MGAACNWRLFVPDKLPDTPSPSLVMLPILAWGRDAHAPQLVLEHDAAQTRLRVALGDNLRMRANHSPQSALEIELLSTTKGV